VILLLKNKLISAVVLAICISSSTSVLASPQQSTLSHSQNQSTQSYYEWNNSIENQIELLDNQIEQNMSQLNEYNTKLQALNYDIVKNKNSILVLRNNIKSLENISKKRIRVMYENGPNLMYLKILLSSDNFPTLISTINTTVNIFNFDKKCLSDLNDTKRNKEAVLRDLTSKQKFVTKLKDDIENKLILLNTQKENEKKLLLEYNKLNKSAPPAKSNISLSRGDIITDNSVVNYALTFLGVPYLWGGTTPQGFDCSGFVQYVYAHFGVNIPRVSEDQQNHGTPVLLRENLKPGDLIFFGKPAHHVGMYIGDNKYVQAPHTGDVVKVSDLGYFTSAMRIK
jgi:cell wall-associated NlpC family hydrolase